MQKQVRTPGSLKLCALKLVASTLGIHELRAARDALVELHRARTTSTLITMLRGVAPRDLHPALDAITYVQVLANGYIVRLHTGHARSPDVRCQCTQFHLPQSPYGPITGHRSGAFSRDLHGWLQTTRVTDYGGYEGEISLLRFMAEWISEQSG